MALQNAKVKISLGSVFLMLATVGCVTSNTHKEEESEPVSLSPVKPAHIAPEECVNYVQLKADADYLCEMADGNTRPLKPGERRSQPLSREEIADVISSNSEDSDACLSAARRADSKAEGKTVIKFEIASGGKVTSASYVKERSTYKNEKLATCLIEKIKLWRFPVLQSDEPIEISYPFVLVNPELNPLQGGSSLEKK